MLKKLDLPNGQWIEVKSKRNVQDAEDLNAYSSRGLYADGKRVDFSTVRFHTALAAIYIRNWSDGILDEEGKPVRWPSGKSFDERTKAIRRLDIDVMDEITKALDGHADVIKAESDDEKKDTQAGETDSESNSPSAS